MDNSFFVLSKQQVDISLFDICTWDFEKSNSFLEMGMEIANYTERHLDMLLAVPLISSADTVKDLLPVIARDPKTSRFIFNDRVESFDPIDGSLSNGVNITFEDNGAMTILPAVDIKTDATAGTISFSCDIPQSAAGRIYMRILIVTDLPTIAHVHNGIAKATYLYDIKLNEKRNLPDNIQHLTETGFRICRVAECTCQHIVPKMYDIAFVDGSMLKNIRTLEEAFFAIFLPERKDLNTDAYMIVTNSSKNKDSHTFFTVFDKETIGTKQIVFAIGADILCNLLFAAGSVRTIKKTINSELELLNEIPFEFWAACVIFVIVVIVFFGGRIKIPLLKGKKLTIKI
ncbi:MAG: hypothetical protein K2L01_05965 [Rikenellaceae bacterium]|nr:hypothetical protein [Rikenellaceae bacterium]